MKQLLLDNSLQVDEISLLEFRQQIASFGSKKNQNPKLILKKGKRIGMFLPSEEIEKYLQLKKRDNLLELYNSFKPELNILGDNFLAKSGKTTTNLSVDELVDLVPKD